MYKLANQILDIYDDVPMTGIRKLASKSPDIVMMTRGDRAKLEDTDFALSIITKTAQVLNKYPINDRDSVWLSNEYFDMNHLKMPEQARAIAAGHIKTACEKFEVKPSPSVECLAQEAVHNIYYEQDMMTTKTASVKHINLRGFGEIEKIANNDTVATYVMPTPSHVKLAEKYFATYNKKMPVDLRAKYARAIQKRAGALGMQAVKGEVGKYSANHYSAHMDAHFSKRAALLDHKPEDKLMIKKLGSLKDRFSPQDMAKLLSAFDKKAGLDKYYDGHIVDPYIAVLGLENPNREYLYKKADSSMTDDELSKVVQTKYAAIKGYFGKSIADELKKDPTSIFQGLPNDYKEILVGIANGQL